MNEAMQAAGSYGVMLGLTLVLVGAFVGVLAILLSRGQRFFSVAALVLVVVGCVIDILSAVALWPWGAITWAGP